MLLLRSNIVFPPGSRFQDSLLESLIILIVQVNRVRAPSVSLLLHLRGLLRTVRSRTRDGAGSAGFLAAGWGEGSTVRLPIDQLKDP